MSTSTAPGASAPIDSKSRPSLSPAVAQALGCLVNEIGTIANSIRHTRYFDRSDDAHEALVAEIDGLVMQCIRVGIFADKAAQLLGRHSIGQTVGDAEAWLFDSRLQEVLREAAADAAEHADEGRTMADTTAERPPLSQSAADDVSTPLDKAHAIALTLSMAPVDDHVGDVAVAIVDYIEAARAALAKLTEAHHG